MTYSSQKTDPGIVFELLFRLRGTLIQARDISRFRLNVSQRKQWRARLKEADLRTVYEFVTEQIPPLQINSELFALAEFLCEVEPEVYCEIGVANGGTNFFISRSCPSIQQVIGVDVHIKNAHILKDLNRPDCRVSLIDGRSDWRSVWKAVACSLKGRKIDALLIDGDHSYDGVRSDFLRYRGLVRDGGLIVFHDIVEDYRTKFGKETTRYTGGVPRFFGQVSKLYTYRTFVEDPEQDGFGIGCIEYRSGIDPELCGGATIPADSRLGSA